MTETEREVIEQALDRKAVYVYKRYPCSMDSELVWFWIYFTDRHHYIVYSLMVDSYNAKHYGLFDSLEFKKEYLLKDLKIGMCQEQLDI